MGIDFKKMKSLSADLAKKAGGDGDKLYLYANKLGEEEFIRILPPPPKMNGAYFLEVEGWWVNGKFVISHSTWGGDDYIKEEVDYAREWATAKVDGDKIRDPELLALLDKKKDGKQPVIKKETRYLIPILHLECKFDDNEDLTEVIIIDDMAKILVAKPTLMVAINEQVTSRANMNKTEDGIADMVKGKILIVGKSGKELNTTYKCITYAEVDMSSTPKFYTELLDVEAITKKQLKSEDATRSIIRNYLYGEPIIEDKEGASAEPPARKGTSIKLNKGNSEPAEQEKVEPAAEAPSPAAGKKKPGVRVGTAAKVDEKVPAEPVAETTGSKVRVGPPKPGAKSNASRSLLEDATKDLNDLS